MKMRIRIFHAYSHLSCITRILRRSSHKLACCDVDFEYTTLWDTFRQEIGSIFFI